MSADTTSPELQTLKKCDTHLMSVLQDADRPLVNFLAEEGFIREDLRQKVVEPRSMLTAAQKAGELVEKIRSAVSLDREKYHILVNYFKRSGPFYESVVARMNEKFNEIKEERECEKAVASSVQRRTRESSSQQQSASNEEEQNDSVENDREDEKDDRKKRSIRMWLHYILCITATVGMLMSVMFPPHDEGITTEKVWVYLITTFLVGGSLYFYKEPRIENTKNFSFPSWLFKLENTIRIISSIYLFIVYYTYHKSEQGLGVLLVVHICTMVCLVCSVGPSTSFMHFLVFLNDFHCFFLIWVEMSEIHPGYIALLFLISLYIYIVCNKPNSLVSFYVNKVYSDPHFLVIFPVLLTLIIFCISLGSYFLSPGTYPGYFAVPCFFSFYVYKVLHNPNSQEAFVVVFTTLAVFYISLCSHYVGLHYILWLLGAILWISTLVWFRSTQLNPGKKKPWMQRYMKVISIIYMLTCAWAGFVMKYFKLKPEF